MTQLDSMYTSLKKELYQLPSKEEVVEAMIINLQTRIKILNRQLEILERINDLKQRKSHGILDI
ncbi:MAG: hypothetical protein HC880_19775 [Bacteroidia bacterium]|nr:hypothetical protein [Bacteroidia bacterium]